MSVYPVEHICPALHSDALENCQHGKENIVEVCDPAVGALPLAPALCPVADTKTSTPGKRTRWRIILYHQTWSREQEENKQNTDSESTHPWNMDNVGIIFFEFKKQRPVLME